MSETTVSKFAEIDSQLLSEVVVAVDACWDKGSPVVGQTPESWQNVAHVAIRRMRSFTRRKISSTDHAAQVRDIAMGLIAAFENDPKLVGPMISDYEYVAERILETSKGVEDHSA